MADNKIQNLADVQTIQEFVSWQQEHQRHGILVCDDEFDDIALLKTQGTNFGLVLRCKVAKKDLIGPKNLMARVFVEPEVLVKRKFYDEWNTTQLGGKIGNPRLEIEQLLADHPATEFEDLKEIISSIVDLTRRNGKIVRMTIIAPCARLLTAMLHDPRLNTRQWELVNYVGEYNLTLSGPLRHIISYNDLISNTSSTTTSTTTSSNTSFECPIVTLVDISRAVFFNNNPENMRSGASLLGGEDGKIWQAIKKYCPVEFAAFSNFQASFNKTLIAPKRILEEKDYKDLTQDPTCKLQLDELEQLYENDLAEYRSTLLKLKNSSVDSKIIPKIRPKKWSTIQDAGIDTPIGDVCLALIPYLSNHCPHANFNIKRGNWSVDAGGKWSVITSSSSSSSSAMTIQLMNPIECRPYVVRFYLQEVFGLTKTLCDLLII